MKHIKGFFALALTAIIYGINDNIIKILSKQMTAYQQIFLRACVASILIIIISSFTKNIWKIKKISLGHLILYSIFAPAAIILFTLGVSYTTVPNAIFAFYSSSFLFSFIVGSIVFKEKMTILKMISFIFIIVGLLFFTYPFDTKAINAGFLASFLSGVFLSAENSLSKHFKNNISNILLIIIQIFGTLLISLCTIISTKQQFFPHVSPLSWTLGILFGFTLTIVIYLPIIGFQNFNFDLGTIIVSGELFFAPFFAWILLHEYLTKLELVGGICMAIAIMLPHVRYLFSKKKFYHP